MINIGIFTHNFPEDKTDRRNAGVFVNDIAQELSKKDRVTVFCPGKKGKGNKIGKVDIVNFPIINDKKLGEFKLWSPFDIARFFYFFISGLTNLSGFVKKNNININIAMWAFPSGVFAFLSKKFYKIPYVVWCLGSDIYVYAKYPVIGFAIREILKSADYVFADGIDISNQAEKISGRKCVFLPSASSAKFRKILTKRKHDKVILTFVGRMEPVKGPDILLNSLGLLGMNLDKFKINFVGAGSLLRELEEKAREKIFENNIRFYGNIDNFQKISELIQGSDWIVISSRSDSIPLVFSEAMKCGTPVIAADLYDLSYLVKKYKVGFLFKHGNPKSLATVINKLPVLRDQQKVFLRNTKLSSNFFNISKSSSKLESYLVRVAQK